jgi:hypothetical protein
VWDGQALSAVGNIGARGPQCRKKEWDAQSWATIIRLIDERKKEALGMSHSWKRH